MPAAFAQPLSWESRFQFPDGDRYLLLQIWASNVYEYFHDDPRFSFATSLYFKEEDLIVDFVHELGNEDNCRTPPDPDGLKQYPIGFIYLDVYSGLTKFSREFIHHDLVLPKIPYQGHISQPRDYLTYSENILNLIQVYQSSPVKHSLL
jgi:hypothetical protein